MKEYPILFSSEMVRAILEDRKTATRRMSDRWGKAEAGDRLWVKETWTEDYFDGKRIILYKEEWGDKSDYPKYHPIQQSKWKPSIFMPRDLSRIILEVTKDSFKQKLWNMTEEDAIKEGCEGQYDGTQDKLITPLANFVKIWDSINKQRGFAWDTNPFCWVISFKRIS